MILWPSCLPQQILLNTQQEHLGNMMLRTSMETGPQKVRRRFTAAPRPLVGDIILTESQLTFFRNWFDKALLGGTLRFGWVDPWGNQVITDLLTNGGFNTNVAGWNAGDGTITSITPTPELYGNCLSLNRTGGTYQTAYQLVSLTAGNSYEYYGWIKSGSSGDELGDIIVVDETTSLERGRHRITTNSFWQFLFISFTAENSGNHTFYCEKVGDTNGTMLFDELSLVDITTGPIEMRFVEPPSLSPVSGELIKVGMSLEILP